METYIRSQPNTPHPSTRNRAYQTTYQREYSILKQISNDDEGVPAGQRFLIGCPYQLSDPVGTTSYTTDYPQNNNVKREGPIRPNTPRANRPHIHPHFPHVSSRQPITLAPIMTEEIKQALKNQITSTYRTDYIGTPQAFPLPLAYNQSRSFWQNRAYRTSDNEQQNTSEYPVRSTTAPIGRYAHTRRTPADGIIPLTLAMWRKGSSETAYKKEFSGKVPSLLYMKTFVDSFAGPMNQ
ncbi:unnamed protein product [Adineta steineri]|uniref:Uncharacterized protein n=1 Tax=Adineta steineri TaxID=433720 RepID=A0A815RQ22_9BILA|nr:unnamed protein product [Adineta steineri]CAF1479357.1 unnamed protein product [Adineta steineri]